MRLNDESTEVYIEYLDKADRLQKMGCREDLNVTELAELIYQKDRNNDRKKSNE